MGAGINFTPLLEEILLHCPTCPSGYNKLFKRFQSLQRGLDKS